MLSLMATFRKDGARAQWNAIEQMRNHLEEATPILRDALRSSRSAHVRAWSTTALAELERKAAISDLVASLSDPAMSVRLHAVRALARLGDAKAAQAVVPLLRDPSGSVRLNVMDAILRLGLAGAEKEILARAEDEKWYVRQREARAIAKLNITRGIIVLRSLLSDPHKAVSSEAERALQAMETTGNVASGLVAR